MSATWKLYTCCCYRCRRCSGGGERRERWVSAVAYWKNVWEVRRVGWEETRGLLSPVRESGKNFGTGGFNCAGLVPFGRWKAPVKAGPPDPSSELDQPMGGCNSRLLCEFCAIHAHCSP